MRTNIISFAHLNQPIETATQTPMKGTRRGGKNSKRGTRKRTLMAECPRCEHCQTHLTPVPDLPNSAHLVRDSLSCPEHVSEVREAAKLRKLQRIRATQTPQNERWMAKQRATVARLMEHEQRQKLKKTLMEVDPHCSHCGCELADGHAGPRSACLVIDRLSCLVHVRIVRAYALRDSDQSIIEESVNQAENADIDAQAFWAALAAEAGIR